MKIMMLIGVVLMVLGVIGLVYGGITYTKDKESADLGPIDVSVEEKERLVLHPAFGAVMLAGGLVMTVMGARKKGS